MNFGFDARTKELLRQVANHGTLAAAAHHLGMEAGNASRHLSAAERRLGARLLDRTRGGRGNRARLTPIGRRFLQRTAQHAIALDYDPNAGVTPIQIGARTLYAAGPIPKGPVEFEIPPQSVALERTNPATAVRSVRNRFPVRVESIEPVSEGIYRIGLSAGTLALQADVVRGALRDLRLRQGSRIYATIKAVGVRIDNREPTSA